MSEPAPDVSDQPSEDQINARKDMLLKQLLTSEARLRLNNVKRIIKDDIPVPDLLIVGSGVSGLYAAEMAAEQGLKVLFVEQEDELGGSLLSEQSGENKINNLSSI